MQYSVKVRVSKTYAYWRSHRFFRGVRGKNGGRRVRKGVSGVETFIS